MAMKYKNRCIMCNTPYRQVTRHQHHCIKCLHESGPDLIINQGKFHAEIYTELISYKKLSKLLSSLSKRKENK